MAKQTASTWATGAKASIRAFVDARGLFWALLLFALALVIPAVGIGALIWLRDAVSDFLTGDVHVWVLLVALAGTVASVSGFNLLLIRRANASQLRPDPGWRAYAPRHIDHFDVRWPVSWVSGSASVGQPRCTTDYTILGWLLQVKGTRTKKVVPLPDWWKTIDAHMMRFQCSKCDVVYDLRRHGYAMSFALKFVENRAWGEYEVAREAAAAAKARK